MLHTVQKDADHNTSAKVSKRGQTIVAPLAYSKFYFASAVVINTAYNLVIPKPGKKFVITDIILSADKGVSGTNGAIVELYEAETPNTLVVSTSIYTDEILKLDRVVLTGLNVLIVTEGRWINVKTNDNTVRASVAGYYIASKGLTDDSSTAGT